MKIILVEDDEALAMGISYSLRQEGYEVHHFNNFQKAKDFFTEESRKSADDMLGLFDVMLPDGNGYDLLQYCRRMGNNIPVIFLTAAADEVNVIQGLELGADDYVSKPFRVKELVSRIKAVSRRYRAADKTVQNTVDREGVMRYRGLEVDTGLAKVYRIDETDEKKGKINVELTPIEYRLLVFLMQNRGQVMSREVILDRLFDGSGNYVDNNTLSVYVKRLREKLGDMDKDNPYIKTVRGIGYIMSVSEQE
jgi:DNA-binding response OmpR family regulator